MYDETERLLEQGAVLLVPEGPARLTEYGKRYYDERWEAIEAHRGVLLDVAKLAEYEYEMWDEIERILRAEGVPVAASGVSQVSMAKVVDHLNGKATFAAVSTVAMALATSAPTSSTTGVLSPNEATYTGYARVSLAAAAFNSASVAAPAVATNASTITFGNCTGGSSNLAGFITADSATVNAGNALWFGALTPVTISTTQTPPTVGTGVLNLSMNTT